MRRKQIEASLVILWLLAGGVHGYASGSPRGDRGKQPASEKNKESVFAREVTGYGENLEDAEQSAVKQAREEIKGFFAEQGSKLSWDLPIAYVREHFVKSFVRLAPKEMPGIGMVREVQLHVELLRKDYDYIMRQDRRFVSQHRMVLLAKVLGGLVAFLALVAGYFRLEEATKGYYTAWLRLATLGIVAAIGAGIWLIS